MQEPDRRAPTPPGVGSGWTYTVAAGQPLPVAHQQPPRTSLLLASKAGSPSKAPRMTTRPMTSHKSAGYTGPALSSTGLPIPASPSSTADQCTELEDRVHSLMEQAAEAANGGDTAGAVTTAREAARAEHRLCALREAAGQADLISLPLKYAVGVCLATAYQTAGQGEEALRTYEDMLRSGLFVQVGAGRGGWVAIGRPIVLWPLRIPTTLPSYLHSSPSCLSAASWMAASEPGQRLCLPGKARCRRAQLPYGA